MNIEREPSVELMEGEKESEVIRGLEGILGLAQTFQQMLFLLGPQEMKFVKKILSFNRILLEPVVSTRTPQSWFKKNIGESKVSDPYPFLRGQLQLHLGHGYGLEAIQTGDIALRVEGKRLRESAQTTLVDDLGAVALSSEFGLIEGNFDYYEAAPKPWDIISADNAMKNFRSAFEYSQPDEDENGNVLYFQFALWGLARTYALQGNRARCMMAIQCAREAFEGFWSMQSSMVEASMKHLSAQGDQIRPGFVSSAAPEVLYAVEESLSFIEPLLWTPGKFGV